MRRLWVIHHLCEFQALTDPFFFIWKWIVPDNSNLSDKSILTLIIHKDNLGIIWDEQVDK